MKIQIKVLGIIFIVLATVSCKKGKVMHTASGTKYILYREHDAKRPVVGDWVTVEMVYKDEKDSIMYDSRKEGKPIRFAVRKSPFAGSFEDALTYLAEGDSATFFVSADSMYAKVFSKNADSSQLRLPKRGSILKFDVSLLKVQPYKEAEMEIAMKESRLERAELDNLEKYLKEKNITAEKQREGYYLIINSHGKGEAIKNGSEVEINYTGRFLNGVQFDSNSRIGKPYHFQVGNHKVIAGWDIAFQKLHKGDKATLIIPSRLGAGSQGIIKPQNSVKSPSDNGYIIPPFSTLVFDVEVLDNPPSAAHNSPSKK